jgi:hypothetical protein
LARFDAVGDFRDGDEPVRPDAVGPDFGTAVGPKEMTLLPTPSADEADIETSKNPIPNKQDTTPNFMIDETRLMMIGNCMYI